MRFFEIASPTLQLMATTRYLKNSATFLRGYAGLEKTLTDFLNFKLQNPTQLWGKKDERFTGGIIKNAFHVHLVHGKVILVYGVSGGALKLYDMVEHNDFESGPSILSLATYIETADLRPIEFQGGPTTKPLSAEQKSELNELFYMMAAEDPDIVRAAIAGDLSGLMEFIRLTVDAPDEVVLDGFGGQAGLITTLSTIMKQMGA
jgi:hypothetical protein